jgi:hypothetical protein
VKGRGLFKLAVWQEYFNEYKADGVKVVNFPLPTA